jgi:hypothetical protein
MTTGSTNERLLAGACECGAVRYRVADTFLYAANCHCSRCRAATDSAFKSFAGIERSKLEVVDGADNLLVHESDELNDTRCATCGSLLFSVVRDGEYVHVAMGSLVHEPGIRPTEHIFVGSKAPWFEITDGLPQAQEYEQRGEMRRRRAPREENFRLNRPGGTSGNAWRNDRHEDCRLSSRAPAR